MRRIGLLFDAIDNMLAYSDTDDHVYAESGNDYQSDIHCDFLSFLGIAQMLRIDFLPITWQPALETVGHGGTAEIRQALVNLQMSLHSNVSHRRNYHNP